MGAIKDYRGVLIPDTTLFNVTWWMYFVVVLLTTLVVIALLVFLLLLPLAMANRNSAAEMMGVSMIAIMCALIIVAPFIILQWFALMWKDWVCLIASLIVASLFLLSEVCALVMGHGKRVSENEYKNSVCGILLSPLASVILLSIMIAEIAKIKPSP